MPRISTWFIFSFHSSMQILKCVPLLYFSLRSWTLMQYLVCFYSLLFPVLKVLLLHTPSKFWVYVEHYECYVMCLDFVVFLNKMLSFILLGSHFTYRLTWSFRTCFKVLLEGVWLYSRTRSSLLLWHVMDWMFVPPPPHSYVEAIPPSVMLLGGRDFGR